MIASGASVVEQLLDRGVRGGTDTRRGGRRRARARRRRPPTIVGVGEVVEQLRGTPARCCRRRRGRTAGVTPPPPARSSASASAAATASASRGLVPLVPRQHEHPVEVARTCPGTAPARSRAPRAARAGTASGSCRTCAARGTPGSRRPASGCSAARSRHRGRRAAPRARADHRRRPSGSTSSGTFHQVATSPGATVGQRRPRQCRRSRRGSRVTVACRCATAAARPSSWALATADGELGGAQVQREELVVGIGLAVRPALVHEDPRPARDRVVVGDDESALTGREVLALLGREAGDRPERADRPARRAR